MLYKARLIKKNEVTQQKQPIPSKKQELLEKRNQFLAAQKTMQATKEWLASQRQEQRQARETFASLFAYHDPQSV